MGSDIEIPVRECRHPTCKNITVNNCPLCNSCLRNTIRRFLHVEGSMNMSFQGTPNKYQTERIVYWYHYVIKNIEELIKAEEDQIKRHGPGYDRDSLTPYIKLID